MSKIGTNENWRDHMPRGVLDPQCPRGEPVETPTDRRMLWHVEGILAVCATTDYLRDIARDLSQYLHETCEHHWHEFEYEGESDIPAHRQCLWCNEVEWLDGAP